MIHAGRCYTVRQTQMRVGSFFAYQENRSLRSLPFPAPFPDAGGGQLLRFHCVLTVPCFAVPSVPSFFILYIIIYMYIHSGEYMDRERGNGGNGKTSRSGNTVETQWLPISPAEGTAVGTGNGTGLEASRSRCADGCATTLKFLMSLSWDTEHWNTVWWILLHQNH